MQTVKIQTTQNIDIDYEVAGLGDRILARLIDIGFFIALLIIGVIAAGMASYNKVFTITLALICGIVFAFYDLVCEIFFNGQSAGKRIMKIKVISLTGARPSISQYLLRWLFRIVDFSITSGVCALICVAVSDKKQRVGDIVAGTTLIKTVPRTKIDNLVFTSSADDYTPVYNEVSQLNDNDIVLIHEVISSYKKTGNTVIVYNMAERIKKYLSISSPPEVNDYRFLETIIKDYSHITAAMNV